MFLGNSFNIPDVYDFLDARVNYIYAQYLFFQTKFRFTLDLVYFLYWNQYDPTTVIKNIVYWFISKINGDVCGRVIINFNERITVCRNFGRCHIQDIILYH